jgi:hypothetical protein
MTAKPAKFDAQIIPALASVSRRYAVTVAEEARSATSAHLASTFAHEFLQPLVQLLSIGMPLGRPGLKMLQRPLNRFKCGFRQGIHELMKSVPVRRPHD